MASSENLASIDPCAFRPTFNDCWISELFARDTEALTKALQKSLQPVVVPYSDAAFSANIFRSEPLQAPTPTVSGLSGSDPDTPSSAAATPKRQRGAVPHAVAGGKISKRKSRATKRSQTTFITADPANFRQMVQQVTGVRFGCAAPQLSLLAAPILKPEPQRACGGRLPGTGACLPTLDTSALLLDHHSNQQSQQTPLVGSTTAMTSLVAAAGGSAPVMGSSFTEGGGGGGGGGGGFDFDAFPSFPTLESWKVM